MKTLLSLVLVLLTMICLGQSYNRSTKERIKSDSIMKIEIRNDSIASYKCSKCGDTTSYYMGLTKTKPLMTIWKCVKCGNITKRSIDKPCPVNNGMLGDNMPTISFNEWKNNSMYVSGDYNYEKATIFESGKFTINLDGFKVTDTIWVMAGKRRVGIPAYKFLEYFKEESIYPSLNGRMNLNVFDHITPTTK